MSREHRVETLEQLRSRMGEVFTHCAKAFRRSELWRPETWNPLEVSFGAQFAAQLGREDDRALIEQVDAGIEASNGDL